MVLVQAPGVEDPVTVVTKHLEYPDAPNDVRHHPNHDITHILHLKHIILIRRNLKMQKKMQYVI